MITNKLSWLNHQPLSLGVIKTCPEDFIVDEDLGFEPDGEGEHIFVRLKKVNCNTLFVAEQLAKFANIPLRSVSYAGLKDRYAVTTQWFCLHVPGKQMPDFNQFKLAECQVLSVNRHKRKLRIGYLKGNQFTITIRHIDQPEDVEKRLANIAKHGIPNYFGHQRFGRDYHNIIQAYRWAAKEISVKQRHRRSFYLSAARSWVFNQIVSARIQAGLSEQVLVGDAIQLANRGSWFIVQHHELESVQQRLDDGNVYLTAPLPGKGLDTTQFDALLWERQHTEKYNQLINLVISEGVEAGRRAIKVIPRHLQWEWLSEQTLRLTFWLNAGSFATSLLRELINAETAMANELIDNLL